MTYKKPTMTYKPKKRKVVKSKGGVGLTKADRDKKKAYNKKVKASKQYETKGGKRTKAGKTQARIDKLAKKRSLRKSSGRKPRKGIQRRINRLTRKRNRQSSKKK